MNRRSKAPPSFAALVQAWFAEYLTQQRALSAHTIAPYRDSFVHFLEFAEARLGKSPTMMTLADMTPDLIVGFLEHLERQRHNCVRNCNARLAALRSFLKFAAHRDVASLHVIERALGVPVKRFERPMLSYLSLEEMLAVIGKPDDSWLSHRDHAMFLLIYNTGARVSEIIGVKVGDVVLDEGSACVHLRGKGRKQRTVPLWQSTAKTIRAWLKVNPEFQPTSPLFPNRNGQAMTRANVALRLTWLPETLPKRAPALQNDMYRLIPSVTPPPCTCCRQASTSASLHYGSDMRAPSRRITMSKPMSP